MGCVYLIEDPANGIFKIGRTTNLESRTRHYKTHNPTAKWLSVVEVESSLLVETKLKTQVRQDWNQVQGTTEWFYGTMPVDKFHALVDDIISLIPHVWDDDGFSSNEIVLERLSSFFDQAGLPLPALCMAAFQSDDYEWAEYIKIDVKLFPNVLEPLGIQIKVDDFLSNLILMLCTPEEMDLNQLMGLIPPGNFSFCWEESLPTDGSADWITEALRDLDARLLLTEVVNITNPTYQPPDKPEDSVS